MARAGSKKDHRPQQAEIDAILAKIENDERAAEELLRRLSESGHFEYQQILDAARGDGADSPVKFLAWIGVRLAAYCGNDAIEAAKLMQRDPDFALALLTEVLDSKAASVTSHAPRPDGPEDPCFFWWSGVRHEMRVEPMQWDVLKAMWPNELTTIAKVGAEVWNDRYRSWSQIKYHVSKLNTAFERHGLGILFEKSGEFIRCVLPS